MSAIGELIAKKCAASKSFAQAYDEESERLETACALMKLREAEGLTQQQLAQKSGKPQSTIARIENGNMNVSVAVLSQIAKSVGKKLKIRFVDESVNSPKDGKLQGKSDAASFLDR